MTWPYFNGTGLAELMVYSNSVTPNGSFGTFIVIGLFSVVFITLKNFYSTERCLVTASFLTMLLSGILYAGGVIKDSVMILVVTVFLVMVAIFVIKGE